MDRDMNILYILGVPLGYVMEWIYNLIPNYGWDIIIFTIVIRLLSIPLQLNQQLLLRLGRGDDAQLHQLVIVLLGGEIGRAHV